MKNQYECPNCGDPLTANHKCFPHNYDCYEPIELDDQNNDILINKSGNSIEAIDKSSSNALDESASSEDREVVEDNKFLQIYRDIYSDKDVQKSRKITIPTSDLYRFISIAERNLELRTCDNCSKQDDCEILRLIFGNSDVENSDFDSSEFHCNFHEKKQE